MAAKTPKITQELIDHLEECFPDRVPDVLDNDREIWIAVGAVKVIRYLKRLLKEQNENILEN